MKAQRTKDQLYPFSHTVGKPGSASALFGETTPFRRVHLQWRDRHRWSRREEVVSPRRVQRGGTMLNFANLAPSISADAT